MIYIDGAHAVYADMKGHTGVYATEGSGAMYSASTKLKLNTISSTETELVSVGEKLPKSLWFRLFRIAQGRNDDEDILMQDNQSCMLLENNGRYSAGKGSKHIDIRYFFVTDRIEKKHIKVKYCPTEEMIADFFTKPLQGALFYKFRDAVLGINANDFEGYKEKYYQALEKYRLINKQASTSLQECVGNVITQDANHDPGVRASSHKTGKVLNKGANQFESQEINSAKRNTNMNRIKDDKRKNNRPAARHAAKSRNGGSDGEIRDLSLFQIYAK